MPVVVSPNIYSGRINPSWTLSDEQASTLLSAIQAAGDKHSLTDAVQTLEVDSRTLTWFVEVDGTDEAANNLRKEGCLRLQIGPGFVHYENEHGNSLAIQQDASTQSIIDHLWQTMPDSEHKQDLKATVEENHKKPFHAVAKITPGQVQLLSSAGDKPSLLGGINTHEPPSTKDIAPWNGTYQRYNNCYAYGNNVFFADKTHGLHAQPGTGSHHPLTSPITSAKVLQCMASDNVLAAPGHPDPAKVPVPPKGKHVMAYWFKDAKKEHDKDFHYARLNADKTWSDKPGQTKARALPEGHPQQDHEGYTFITYAFGFHADSIIQ